MKKTGLKIWGLWDEDGKIQQKAQLRSRKKLESPVKYREKQEKPEEEKYGKKERMEEKGISQKEQKGVEKSRLPLNRF